MMPISEINIGDMYRNPLYTNGVEFVVVDINQEEKLVQVQPISSQSSEVKPVGKPFWKSNRDRMFSEGWRVLKGV